MSALNIRGNAARVDDPHGDERAFWLERYQRTRAETERRAALLSAEDQAVQSMADASPTKWHRAHTSWFFEEFLLGRFATEYRVVSPAYRVLFNSYYDAFGERHPRDRRGLLTRPDGAAVTAYRQAVDRAVADWIRHADVLTRGAEEILALGLAHEEQHQELILTDILHAFAENPLDPVYDETWSDGAAEAPGFGMMIACSGGSCAIGTDGAAFSFDNERPRHSVRLAPFHICDNLVTNEAWLAFMGDGGYETATLWLADGWAEAKRQGWQAPGYWRREPDGTWSVMTPAGRLALDPRKPVCHVSYYEADAFARWAGKRLPTEEEWEIAAVAGVLANAFTARWQWTRSPYMPYPGYRPPAGAIGEYNGKFMINQMVLRGGSLATPPGHTRATYRNFFYPHQRWQFTGLRLASDTH